jgi:hypothetical protein
MSSVIDIFLDLIPAVSMPTSFSGLYWRRFQEKIGGRRWAGERIIVRI